MIRYEDISAAIQVRHLQVRLGEAVVLTPTDSAGDAAAKLAPHGFDQAPVLDGGRVLGLFNVADVPTGNPLVGDCVRPIRPEYLVSADAPVSRVLAWLIEAPCLFVLDGRQITGFIVEADLNKQPARTYFYLLVASLEAGLAGLIREWMHGDEFVLLPVLSQAMRSRVLEMRAEAQSDDVDADLVAYFLFTDILRVIGHVPEMRSQLGVSSAKSWRKRTGALIGLRNAVMHPARDLLGPDRPVARLVELDALLRDLLRRVEATQAVAHDLV
jgi:CBS domain-containing protein